MNRLGHRRDVITMLLLGPFVGGCSRDQFFDISWDEEVQLHDGGVLLVHVKYTYERRVNRLSIDRYGSSTLRNTTLTFDAGPPNGLVTQLFVHQRPMALDISEGTWFVVLQGRAGTAVQDWGSDQNGNGQRTAHLVGKLFKPISIDELPIWMSSANLLMDYAPLNELAALNGTRVNLADKLHYIQKYPLNPIDRHIARPHAASWSPK